MGANKVLLYRTENSAQYYVAAWIGGEFGESGYMYMLAVYLCCPPETITMLLTSYTPV